MPRTGLPPSVEREVVAVGPTWPSLARDPRARFAARAPHGTPRRPRAPAARTRAPSVEPRRADAREGPRARRAQALGGLRPRRAERRARAAPSALPTPSRSPRVLTSRLEHALPRAHRLARSSTLVPSDAGRHVERDAVEQPPPLDARLPPRAPSTPGWNTTTGVRNGVGGERSAGACRRCAWRRSPRRMPDALLARPRRPRRRAPHARRLAARAARALEPRRAEAPRRREDVDGLEQVRLALPVVAGEDVEPRPELEVDLREVPEVADAQRLDRERPHAHQMRIGITTARNCRAPDRLHDRRIELAAEAELDLVLVERAEHVEEVLRVEADRSCSARRTRSAPRRSPRRSRATRVVMRIVPFASPSFTPPVRSLAATDTARSASANGARGARARASRSAAG